jgi:hypothetical protein
MKYNENRYEVGQTYEFKIGDKVKITSRKHPHWDCFELNDVCIVSECAHVIFPKGTCIKIKRISDNHIQCVYLDDIELFNQNTVTKSTKFKINDYYIHKNDRTIWQVKEIYNNTSILLIENDNYYTATLNELNENYKRLPNPGERIKYESFPYDISIVKEVKDYNIFCDNPNYNWNSKYKSRNSSDGLAWEIIEEEKDKEIKEIKVGQIWENMSGSKDKMEIIKINNISDIEIEWEKHVIGSIYGWTAEEICRRFTFISDGKIKNNVSKIIKEEKKYFAYNIGDMFMAPNGHTIYTLENIDYVLDMVTASFITDFGRKALKINIPLTEFVLCKQIAKNNKINIVDPAIKEVDINPYIKIGDEFENIMACAGTQKGEVIKVNKTDNNFIYYGNQHTWHKSWFPPISNEHFKKLEPKQDSNNFKVGDEVEVITPDVPTLIGLRTRIAKINSSSYISIEYSKGWADLDIGDKRYYYVRPTSLKKIECDKINPSYSSPKNINKFEVGDIVSTKDYKVGTITTKIYDADTNKSTYGITFHESLPRMICKENEIELYESNPLLLTLNKELNKELKSEVDLYNRSLGKLEKDNSHHSIIFIPKLFDNGYKSTASNKLFDVKIK